MPADVIVVGTPTDITRALSSRDATSHAANHPAGDDCRLTLPTVAVSYGLDPKEAGGGAELAAVLRDYFGHLMSD